MYDFVNSKPLQRAAIYCVNKFSLGASDDLHAFQLLIQQFRAPIVEIIWKTGISIFGNGCVLR